MSDIHYISARGLGAEIVICKDSPRSYPIHNHVSVITAGLVLEGSIKLTVAQTEQICRAGHGFVIPPYIPHAIEAPHPYSLLSVCLNKERIPLAGSIESKLSTLIPGTLCFNQPADSQAVPLARAFELLKDFSAKETYMDPLIAQLIHQLESHPEAAYGIEDMARTACMSKYYFIRKFKGAAGLTPHQFLIQNRVRRAKRLINQNTSITEAALTAGFFDQSHFIKHFEKLVGMTPSDYKMSFRELASLISGSV